MSDGYTKLFRSILHSTIWQEDVFVKIVWITMMAMADRDGIVSASIPGLAKEAGVPVDACEAALQKFMAPDKYSRTPDNEGRRIGKVDGGWELLNYMKYRRLMDAEDQREKAAERKRRQRTRHALSRSVTDVPPSHDIAKAEAEEKAEAGSEISETKIAAAAYSNPREAPAPAQPVRGEDPEIRTVIEAVLREPRLRSIPRANVLDVVTHAMPVGKRLKPECYLQAVSDCARDTIEGEQAHETLKRLRKYLDNARMPRGSPGERERAPTLDREIERMTTAMRLGKEVA